MSETSTDDISNKKVGFVEELENASVRKQIEFEFNQIFDTAVDGMRIVDKDFKNLMVNKTFVNMTGIPRDKIVGKKCYEVFPGNLCRTSKCPLTQILAGEKHVEVVAEKERTDGKKISCILTATPHIDFTGDVIGIVEDFKDITDYKKVEEELTKSKERYKQLLSTATDYAYTVNVLENGRSFETSYNPGCEAVTGYTPEEYKADSYLWYRMIYEEDQDAVLNQISELLSGRDVGSLEHRIIHRDGSIRWVKNELILHLDEHENLVSYDGLITDITKRKKMEENLQESEEKFRTLYESTTDAIMLLDENGFFDCNAATLRIFGLPSMNRFISKHPYDLSPPKQPDGKDSLAAFNEHIATAFEKGSDYFEWMHKCADGTIFPATVLLNHMKLKDKDILQAVVRNITEQKRSEKEIIKKNMDLKVAHKKLSSLNKDLERKVKDRTAKVEKLLKQKDEFIGQLGHDLKNPLNPLVNLLPIVEKHEKDPESKELLHVINRNVDYMKNLVVKTIKLARLNASGTEFSFEDINLLEKINVVVEKNKPMLDEDHMMVESKINEDIIVKADELRLEELFDNLVNNAVKYSPNGGNITIDAKEDKDFVIVSVKDLGIGMTEGQLDHIFDEFYKADESRHDFHSSGLGLTICKRIVEKHGGRIWAESSGEGHGSTVFFTIPKS
jgi:PAS domain S-box-containing protein